jgi:ATP synthase alpha/beta chain, C terminal domain
LKQAQYSPMPLGLQVAEIWAGTNGHLDKVAIPRVKEWEEGFARFLRADHKDLLSSIETKKALDDDLTKQLEKAVKAFNRQFGVEDAEAAEEPKGEQTEEKDAGAKAEAAASEAAAEKDRKAEEERRKTEERRQNERRSGTTTASGQKKERRAAERRAAPRRATDPKPSPAAAKGEGRPARTSQQKSKPKAAAPESRETPRRKK